MAIFEALWPSEECFHNFQELVRNHFQKVSGNWIQFILEIGTEMDINFVSIFIWKREVMEMINTTVFPKSRLSVIFQ